MSQTTHADVLAEAVKHLGDTMDASPDGVYIWVDEQQKDCNEQLASMFGRTVDDWRACENFLESFVAPDDRNAYAGNYHAMVANLVRPITFRFRGLCKDGSTFAAETDMIPTTFAGHPVAYHFVRKLEE